MASTTMTQLSTLRGHLDTAIRDHAIGHQPTPLIQATPKKERSSIHKTCGCLHSQTLCSCFSSSVFSADGELNQELANNDAPARSVRRRPAMSNLHRNQPMPEYADRQSRGRAMTRKPLIRKKAMSAGPHMRMRHRFTSPDRYTALRTGLCASSSPLRTSQSPASLELHERLDRHRNVAINPFQSNIRVASHALARPTPGRSRSFQPPHYVPSFINVNMTGESRLETQPNHFNLHRTTDIDIWPLGNWNFSTGHIHGVDWGNGIITASGSNAPMWNSNFVTPNSKDEYIRKQERRLALSLEIDLARRVLPVSDPRTFETAIACRGRGDHRWINASWTASHPSSGYSTNPISHKQEKAVPTTAFRVLDAPRLKDDYYCSVLAYCRTFRTLAVALTHRVYLWTERYGVRYPPLAPVRPSNYITCLAFSSEKGGKAILATSRNSGSVTLWSLLEKRARFEIPHCSASCSVAFRPTTTPRATSYDGRITDCEDLLVGDDMGHVFYYSVEWPSHDPGSVILLVKINAHSQNVCGLAWAPDGGCFVSGGNDNYALLFCANDVLRSHHLIEHTPEDELTSADKRNNVMSDLTEISNFSSRNHRRSRTLSPERSRHSVVNSRTHQPPASLSASNIPPEDNRNPSHPPVQPRSAPPTPPRSPATAFSDLENVYSHPNRIEVTNVHRYSFSHSAAVKAISFAPWQPSLLATGGGSNDKQIHFHHTETGTTLAVINVFAQVTSLSWSMTKREIAATFGYAQPDHEVRIAVFAWPSCECVMSIPWERKANGEVGRALWAIPYPGGPNDVAPERAREEWERETSWGAGGTRNLRLTTTTAAIARRDSLLTPETSPERKIDSIAQGRVRNITRGEGETWASRTEEEGSLIIACCDQTVKFFEVWAGKSKGKYHGLGSKPGVLGGSKVLEGWCEGIAIEEIGSGNDVIQ